MAPLSQPPHGSNICFACTRTHARTHITHRCIQFANLHQRMCERARLYVRIRNLIYILTAVHIIIWTRSAIFIWIGLWVSCRGIEAEICKILNIKWAGHCWNAVFEVVKCDSCALRPDHRNDVYHFEKEKSCTSEFPLISFYFFPADTVTSLRFLNDAYETVVINGLRRAFTCETLPAPSCSWILCFAHDFHQPKNLLYSL